MKHHLMFVVLVFTFLGCRQDVNDNGARKRSINDISANKDVEQYLENFVGLGALTDSSSPTPALQSISHFKYPNDLAMDLVLSEPQVVQPVEISFDQRGRMWVVQYSQYPFPEGLKVVSVDNFLRYQYDKTPIAPPKGVKGADKITIFEDSDGDGKYDKSTDAVTGLNIATSVVTGRGKVWVLNPPYLLAYPDEDGDGIPNGDPEVVLSGFGLQDLHAVANSLRWGPDGWLYGAQGSTTASTVSSSVTKDVYFSGQIVWRYNTDSHVFEIFAEGGGNTFNLDFDSKGRLYSGDNGYSRGPDFKQGAFYPRSLGKHGAYSDAYTFGNLQNMQLTGEKKRFTHTLIRYEENKLPARYEGKLIAPNALNHYVQLTRMESDGSTFKNIDEEKIVETDDNWFRPVNIKAGPDGAVYIADWYDSRLSNTDPRDTWSKTTGRIYRLRDKNGTVGGAKFDLTKYSTEQLVGLLKSKSKWFRQHALLQFANNRDKSALPQLMPLLKSDNGQDALEALWAINLIGGFNDDIAEIAFNHSDPYVREWAVRLSGDNGNVSPKVSTLLNQLAGKETNPRVRSQIACTAKRLPAQNALPLIKNLLKSHDDIQDPDIPQLTWWAVESKVETNAGDVVSLFKDNSLWKNKIVQDVVLERLMKRLIMAGGNNNYAAAETLLKLSPSQKFSKILATALHEGLQGESVNNLTPELIKDIGPYQSELFGGPLAFGIRGGNKSDIKKALDIIADKNADPNHRISYTQIFGEVSYPESVPYLLQVVFNGQSPAALKQAALFSLQRYDSLRIGEQVSKGNLYLNLRADPATRSDAIDLLTSRVAWTKNLLNSIDVTKTISKDDISEQVARKMSLMGDPEITKVVYKLWPDLKPLTPAEKNDQMKRYVGILKSGQGDVAKGSVLFSANCGMCHRLNNSGGNIGPDLTGYERSNIDNLLLNIVDPNAYIRDGYEVYKITTTDGRILEGKIVSRNGDAITIQPPLGGRKITLFSAEIKEMKEESQSIMPERILDKLSDKEIRDIFSYLKKS